MSHIKANISGNNPVSNHHIPMKDLPQIDVVILALNNYNDTSECLEFVLQSDYDNLHILVVDNGSSDDTNRRIKKDFPAVRVIENKQNLGVPTGFNIGIQDAVNRGANYILLLNNDTTVGSNMVSRLLARAENDLNTAIVMPKILYYGSQNRIWSSGGYFRKFPPKIVYWKDRNSDEAHQIQYASGCAMLIPIWVFEKIGLFDPGYFFYFEDTDFSERVRDRWSSYMVRTGGVCMA